MSTYESLSSTIDEIVDAAIESAMCFAGYHRDGDNYVQSRINQGTYDMLFPEVSGPKAGPPRWIRGNDDDVFAKNYAQELAKVAQIYSEWDSNVRELFRQWQELPDSAQAAPPVNHLYRAASQISTGQDVDNGPDLPANPNIADLDEANGTLSTFAGGTITLFRRLYTRRLYDAILPNQVQAISNIIEGAVTEAAIWPQARKSTASIADAMLAGMKAARPAPEGSPVDAILTVAGLGVAAAALFASGTGALFVGGVGLSLSTVDALKGDDKPEPVKGSHPEDVLSQARDAFIKLDQDITDEESKIGTKFSDVTMRMDTNAALYDLSVPPAFMNSTTAAQIIDKADVIKVDAKRLRTVGLTLLPNVATQFKAAAKELDPYGAEKAWQRGGTIGIPTTGPSTEFESVCNALATILIGTDQELRQAGKHLATAADYFDKTDGQVHTEFSKQRTQMQNDGSAELPYYVPPTPPPPRGGRFLPA